MFFVFLILICISWIIKYLGFIPCACTIYTIQRFIINAERIGIKGDEHMAVVLNKRAFEHAKRLVEKGRYVFDEKDIWSEHQPSAQKENKYIEENGFEEFGKWYLGVDTDEKEDTKGRYKFPYSDFTKVHRCGVLAAENRAGQYKYNDIEQAAAHLHGMIDAARKDV
jgi:hypothetical protein